MQKPPQDSNKQAGMFIVIALIWLIIGWVLRGLVFPNQATLVDEVKQIIEQDSPLTVPSEAALDLAAAQGLINVLDDPFAVVIPPPSSLKFDADFAGETGVVGLVPNVNEAGQLFIETVIQDGPGDQAGVQVGDILISIDDIPVDATTTVTGSALLFRGPIGDAVHLVVQRGDEILTFSPERIERVALEWEMLDGDIGYIAQYTFTTNVPALFKEALTEIMAMNPRAIIWDVRFNGGGSMMVAQDVLSNFITEGDLFEVTLKNDETTMFSATGNALAADIPLYVLVNEFTFSAAETVALTIQERGRGTTVGVTTFGKGTIQNSMKLQDDYLLEYTIGYWFSPNGVSVQGTGVSPEVLASDDPLTSNDETLEAALRLINSQN
ncbi:MAG: PDZ domain-containing protein [Ardenticatenaceae bacterium]|nr:PDZ domain-containing protein [Anaerolineales bacterium]MCB8938521.1 PDZ domain-containing protein [Ardenticatenaceae bacterium]MCB8973654.1 PDZ domain-containing protein [Ardenticatenaceae bacterium]